MGGFGQSLGQLNQTSGLSPALPISTAAASTVYQAHYGLNSLGEYQLYLLIYIPTMYTTSYYWKYAYDFKSLIFILLYKFVHGVG